MVYIILLDNSPKIGNNVNDKINISSILHNILTDENFQTNNATREVQKRIGINMMMTQAKHYIFGHYYN